jgi:hypothetical protein
VYAQLSHCHNLCLSTAKELTSSLTLHLAQRPVEHLVELGNVSSDLVLSRPQRRKSLERLKQSLVALKLRQWLVQVVLLHVLVELTGGHLQRLGVDGADKLHCSVEVGVEVPVGAHTVGKKRVSGMRERVNIDG